MLASRVRMGSGSGNNDVSVNIIVNDESSYELPTNTIYVIPIIKGFEIDPSEIGALGSIPESRVMDIVSLYCGDAIEIPRHSTINITTLKSKYFIMTSDGWMAGRNVYVRSRNVTVEILTRSDYDYHLFRLSEDLEDGDIIELMMSFD